MLVAVFSILLSVGAPAVLLSAPMECSAQPLVLFIEEDTETCSEEPVIRLQTHNGVIELLLEDYLVGVVLSEMPASFHEEALKAQAVAARTFVCRQMEEGKHLGCDLCDQPSCCQAWQSDEDLKKKLGEAYSMCRKKAEAAVLKTEGEVLTYQGDLIEAVYFSCSGGKTEDAVAVWGSEVAYLQSVESTGEEAAPKHITQTEFTVQAFKNKLQEECSLKLTGAPDSWIGETQYSPAGSVVKMMIGEKWFSGNELREIFGLNSAAFRVTVIDDRVIFCVYGYGHRVGMSQYGANAMAERGADYREILQHYYTGVLIESTEKRSSR